MKCVIAARSTENSADSCANDDVILNADYRHIFSMLEICNKRNKLFFKKLKVFYPMHMLVFCPHSLITAHPIDIHLGAFPPPPPPLIATSPLIYFETFFQPPRLLPPPLLFRTGEYIYIQYNICIYNSYKIRANSSLLSKKVKLKYVKERNEIQNN